ncbi:MAG: diguanylate cyclase [Burkholderiales bacterium]|nr:diguanylate cyclase [Burkholderiales bacterium]
MWGLDAPMAAAAAAACGFLAGALPLAWLLGALARRLLAAPREPGPSLSAGAGLRSAAFMDLAEREWARARRYGSGAALLLVELDSPARLAQAHGAAAVDRLVDDLLRLTALTLRPADLITRFGDTRLAVFLAQADATGALDVAERIRERVEKLPLLPLRDRPGAEATPALPVPAKPITTPIATPIATPSASASLGVAPLRLAHANLQALIGDAEEALASARQAGGNCVRSAPVEAGRLRGAAWRGDDRRARPKQGGAA